MKKIFIILAIVFGALTYGQDVKAADLFAVNLSINPQTAGNTATWTISFTIPQDTKLGHILISLGGYTPDLSAGQLAVSGLPQGTAQIGKSNATCVFNCDDLRYYYTNPISVPKGTKVTFTVTNVKNPAKAGHTGLNFIEVFSSPYPQMTLAFSSGEQLLSLSGGNAPIDENLIPLSATNEAPSPVTGIKGVILNELFYQPGAKTTHLDQIKDITKVTDLTLDLLGKERITLKGTLDLSTPEAVAYFQNLSNFLTFDKLTFSVNQDFINYFKVPLDITYYELPYISDPDVLKDDQNILAKSDLENYDFFYLNNKPEVSFSIKYAGKYQLIPHLELNITDNQKITDANNVATFSGQISDPQAQLSIALNAKDQNLKIAIDQNNGNFSFSLPLNPGANLIELTVNSAYGQLGKISRTVTYIAPETKDNTGAAKTSLISPLNIAAVILAIFAIIVLWTIRRMAKKRR